MALSTSAASHVSVWANLRTALPASVKTKCSSERDVRPTQIPVFIWDSSFTTSPGVRPTTFSPNSSTCPE
eukprot:5222454-Alexandrium_andersonii.AAC.1